MPLLADEFDTLCHLAGFDESRLAEAYTYHIRAIGDEGSKRRLAQLLIKLPDWRNRVIELLTAAEPIAPVPEIAKLVLQQREPTHPLASAQGLDCGAFCFDAVIQGDTISFENPSASITDGHAIILNYDRPLDSWAWGTVTREGSRLSAHVTKPSNFDFGGRRLAPPIIIISTLSKSRT